MISNETEKIFMFITNFGFYTIILPMKYNLASHRLTPSPRPVIWIFNVICAVNLSWRTVIIGIIIYNILTQHVSTTNVIFGAYCILALLISVMANYTLLSKMVDWRDVMRHVNALFSINIRLCKFLSSSIRIFVLILSD